MAPTPQLATGTEFVVLLTSAAILRDSVGRPTTDIRHALPGGPSAYELLKGFATAEWVGGFNRTWGLPLAQEWAVQAGSVWRLRTHSALTVDEIEALEWRGVGGRTVEGFGRLLVLADRAGGELSLPEPARQPQAQTGDTPRYPALRGEAGRLAAQMRKRIALHELDKKLVETVQRYRPVGRLSKSQLARLRLRIRREAGKNDFQEFREYLDNTKTRKSADDQFRKFSVAAGGQSPRNLRQWFQKLAEHPATVWDEIVTEPDWEPPALGTESFAFRVDRETTRAYTIRFISALCEHLAKEEVKS